MSTQFCFANVFIKQIKNRSKQTHNCACKQTTAL